MNICRTAISLAFASGFAAQLPLHAQPATLAVLETFQDATGTKSKMTLTTGPDVECNADCDVSVDVTSVAPGMCWANIATGTVKTKRPRLTITWKIKKADPTDPRDYQFADDGIYFLKDINDDVDPTMHFRRRARLSKPTESAWRGTSTASLPIHYTPLVFYNAGTVAAPVPVFCGASDPKIVNVP